MAWVLLILAGLCEVGFTTCLRFVDGFRSVPWTLGFAAAVTASMVLLQFAARSVPMGTAYAVWTGIGALGTALVGILWFGEPAGTARLVLLVGLVGCIAGLKLAGHG